MDKLLEFNRNALHAKLDKCVRDGDSLLALELIRAVSSSVETDRRKISDFGPEHVYTKKVRINGYTREMRFMTPTGIHKYLQIGNIFSKKIVMDYFKVPIVEAPILKTDADGNYITSVVLNYLYERRKRTTKLNLRASKDDIIAYCGLHPKGLNKAKFDEFRV